MTAIKPPVTKSRKRRWLTIGGVILVALLLWPAIRQCDKYWRTRDGLNSLSRGDYARAVELFESAVAKYPSDAQFAFFAAIAHRQNGDLQKFEMALGRAEQLGCSKADLRLQQILAWTQHGLGTADTEAEIRRYCLERTDDFTAEQIYEARAKGFMSLFQVREALQALDHWIDWKPKAIPPRLLRAQVFEQLDHIQRAREDFLVVVKADPENVEARLRYARFLLDAQEHDEASAEFKRCLKQLPGDPRVALGLAEIELLTGGDLSKVKSQLEEILESQSDNALRRKALMHLANLHLTRKQYDKAIALLESPEAKANLDIPTYQSLSRAYAALGNREKSQHYRQVLQKERERRFQINQLNVAIVDNPGDPDLRFQQGQNYWKGGDKEAAVTWWYTAVLAEPLHQPSHEALAQYYATQGNAERAAYHRELGERSVERTFLQAWNAYIINDFDVVREKQAAIARYPSYKHCAQLLSYGLEVKEPPHQLSPAHLEALQRLTEYPRLRNMALTILGSALIQLGQAGPAEEMLLEVIRNDPKAIEAHRWLIALNWDMRALDRTRFHCEQVAELDPYDYRPHRLTGVMAKMVQSFEPAIAAYQEALRRGPPEKIRQEILLELAECQLRVLKPEDALKTLEQANDLVDARVLKAWCYQATQQMDKAKQLLDEALAEEPKHRLANSLRADVAIGESDYTTAIEHLELVTADYPSDDSAWLKLSQAYARTKNLERARETTKRAGDLRQLQMRYTELLEVIGARPEDIASRQELAAIARRMGQGDLAKEWDRAVELMKSRAVSPPVPKAAVPEIVIPGGAAPPKASAELSTLKP